MKILIVDDIEENLYLLETLLKGSGYEVVTAKDGAEALNKLKEESIDMIVSDILMPKMDGFQLCRECKKDKSFKDIPFIFYTATYTDKKDEEFALSLGAEKFIVKPQEPEVFLKVLEETIEEYKKGARITPKEPLKEEEIYLAEYNKRLIKKLEKKVLDLEKSEKRLQKTMEDIIYTIGKIAETRDPYTAGHQKNVSQIAIFIAQEMKLSQDKIKGIRIASLVHDIGKISLPAEILNKPTKLTEIEYSLIKDHSQTGYDILKSIDFPWPIAKIVLQHHERLDGSGYPNNLKGDEIILEARIIGVADVVEAMSSHRPYRPALGRDAALEEISKNKGILYDSEVVDVCLKLFKRKEFKF
jgi:putative nucleotidyltransferase with HDIG domain